MNKFLKLILLATGVSCLSACVEDNSGYYSDNGYGSSTYYQSDANTGYNRNYHHRNSNSQVYTSTQTPTAGYSSSQTPAQPVQQQPEQSGYYSSN